MEWVATFASALLSMTNPLGNAGMFVSLTSDTSDRDARKIAWKSATAVLVILLICTWAGSWALKMAGIDVNELRTAGGIIVLLIGLHMLFNDKSHAQTSEEADAAKTRDSIAIVPLALPIVAGPGTMSLVIATAGQHKAFDDRMSMTIACVAISVLLGVVFSFGKQTAKFLGKSGMAVVTRVMGMILAAIGVGMLADGVRGLMPELFQ